MQSFGRQLNMNSDVPGPVGSTGTSQPEQPEANGPESFGRPVTVTPLTPEPGASNEQSTSLEKSFGRPINVPGFSEPLAEQSAEQPPAGQEEKPLSWTDATWEQRATKPLTETLLGLPETYSREGAGPIEAGVEKGVTGFATGLTSPLNLGLMIATGGLGSLAEGLGAEGITAVAPELAPKVANAARVAAKLTNAGFTGEQLWNISQKSVPQFYVAAKNGDTEGAAEALTGALLGGAAAAMSTAHLVGESEPRWSASNKTIGAYQNQVEIHNIEAKQFASDNAALIKYKPLDMAARLYHEAGGDVNTLERWRSEIANDKSIKSEVQSKFEGLLAQAQNLPPDVRVLSARLRVDYAKDWQEAVEASKKNPAEAKGAENYAGQHTYEPGIEGEADSTLRPSSNRVTKNPAFMKSRTFPTFIDALKAGFIPKDVGLAEARVDYLRQFGTMKGAIAAEDTMLQQQADDGRPVAVSPGAVRHLNGKTVLPLEKDADLSKFDPSDILQKNGKSYLNLADYKDASPPFERFKFVVNDEDGNPIFKKAPVLIHPGYADRINNAFDTNSWFRQTPVVSGLLRASTMAKKTLLSLSPFHYTTEWFRGLQMGLDPVTAFSPPELSADRPAVQIGTKYGLTLLGDRASRTMSAEGLAEHAGVLNKVPGLGPMLDTVENHLFGDWIPRLKAQVWENLAPQLERRHPDWSDERRYSLASNITNAAFGGLNWKQLGVSLASTDFLRLIALAPDFTGSQLLFAKYGVQPGGSIVWNSFARIAAYNFAVAQTLNLLFSGKVQLDHPFSVQDPKDHAKVISIRTMPGDIFHALTDPRGFTMNRLNPLTVRTAWEGLTGRDIRGEKVSGQRQVIDLLRNVTPISLQNFVPQFRYPDETMYQSAFRAGGATVSQDTSPALQKARELAHNRAPGTPMDSTELAHYRFKTQVETALQNGTLQHSALSQLVQQEKLTRLEARTIAAEVRETQGLDPLTASLYLKVHRLPLQDALQVWDTATNAERRALAPLMRKKRIAYRTGAYRNLTARERQKDLVFQRTEQEHFRQ
jgi:hypothetical protein